MGQQLPSLHKPYPPGQVNWRLKRSPLINLGEFPPLGCVEEDWSNESKYGSNGRAPSGSASLAPALGRSVPVAKLD